MVSDAPPTQHWIRRPIIKYGMLLVLAVLAIFHAWMLTGNYEPTRVAAKMGLVVVVLLAANHISLVFLRPLQQQRVIPFQTTLVIGGLGYVLVLFWQQCFQK